MSKTVFLTLLLVMASATSVGQVDKGRAVPDDAAAERTSLLVDLQALEAAAAKLDKPLARARAKAEVAAALWPLDRARAEGLLREAYEATFPEEEERAKLRQRALGAVGSLPTATDRARGEIRERVFEVAGLDKSFADELFRLGAQELGRFEEYYRYTSLSNSLIAEGRTGEAGDYLMRAVAADPTQMAAAVSLLDLAAADRKAADELILRYIERLRAVPLSQTNHSAWRVYTILTGLVFPRQSLPLVAMFKGPDPKYQQIPAAGAKVVRAYLRYVIESMGSLEQSEPGSARELRGFLLSTWLPLRQYAPELAAAFSELEAASRRPGESGALPASGDEDAGSAAYDRRVRQSLDSRQPGELSAAISFALTRRDFPAARKLIDSLPDGAEKAKFAEEVDLRESLSLAAEGDVLAAQRVAERLSKPSSVLQAYPAVVDKCAARKDAACAASAVYQAMKQLKGAEDGAVAPSLCALAKSVAPLNVELASEVLDEAARAANRADRDTGDGRTGIDPEAFKAVAAKNQTRARQAAEALKDPLRRIAALAAVYRRESEELAGRAGSKERPGDK